MSKFSVHRTGTENFTRPVLGKYFDFQEDAEFLQFEMQRTTGLSYCIKEGELPITQVEVEPVIAGIQPIVKTRIPDRHNKYIVAYPLTDAVENLCIQFGIVDEITKQFGQACYNKGAMEDAEIHERKPIVVPKPTRKRVKVKKQKKTKKKRRALNG